jgi:hypothetical protein
VHGTVNGPPLRSFSISVTPILHYGLKSTKTTLG